MSETQFQATPFLLQPGADPALAQTVQPIKYITPPMPAVAADTVKYYMCSLPNASMHRSDGFRISFRNGYYTAKLLPDQQYLDNEIATGHELLRLATENEVYQIRMSENPRAVIKEEVTADLEASIEAKIRAEYEVRLAGLQLTDENRLSGTDAVSRAANTPDTAIKTGSATVFMTSQPAMLKGIVSSDSNKEGAAESGL